MLCARLVLPALPSCSRIPQVEKVRYSDLSPDGFFQEFVAPRKPVVIEGHLAESEGWRGEKWTNDYLRAKVLARFGTRAPVVVQLDPLRARSTAASALPPARLFFLAATKKDPLPYSRGVKTNNGACLPAYGG